MMPTQTNMPEDAHNVGCSEDSQPATRPAFVFSSPAQAKPGRVRAGLTRKGLASDNFFTTAAASLQAPAPPVFSAPANRVPAGQGKAAETTPLAQRLSRVSSAEEPATPMDIDTPAPFQPSESHFSRLDKDIPQSAAAPPSAQPAAPFQFTAAAPGCDEQTSPGLKAASALRGPASKQQAHKTRQHSQAAGLAGRLNMQMNFHATSAAGSSSAGDVDHLQASLGRAFGVEALQQPASNALAGPGNASHLQPQHAAGQPAASQAAADGADSCKSSQTSSPPQKRASPGCADDCSRSDAPESREAPPTPVSVWPGLQQDSAEPFKFQMRPQSAGQPASGTVTPADACTSQQQQQQQQQQPLPFVFAASSSFTFTTAQPVSAPPAASARPDPASASVSHKRAASAAQTAAAPLAARTFTHRPRRSQAEQDQPPTKATPQPHVRAFRHAAHTRQQQQQQKSQMSQPPPATQQKLASKAAGVAAQKEVPFAFAGQSASQTVNIFAATAASGVTFGDSTPQAANDMHKTRGNAAFKSRQYEQALSHYMQGVSCLLGAQADEERCAVLLCNCAAACVQMGRIQEAMQHCNRALQAQPGLVRAHERLITCHQRIGQFAAARECITRLHSLPDGRASAIAAGSEVDSLQQRCTQAQAEAQKAGTFAAGSKALANLQAIALQVPEYALLLMLQADLLMQLDRPAEAVSMLIKAHAAAPRLVARADELWLEAQASYWSGNLEAAAGQLESVADCARLSPPNAALLEGTGYTVPAELGPDRLRQAAAGLRTLLQAKDAGNRAMQQKDHSAALQQYTQALNATPPPPPAFAAVLHSNRASVHLAKSNLLEAVADAGRAHALNPAYAKAIARLGQIMIQLGRHEAAQSMLQAAQKEHGSRPAAAAARADWASVASVLRDAEAGVRRRCPVDHFLLLGLPRTGCTDEQVKKAWKLLALRLHPDKALSHCKFSLGLTSSCRPFLAASEVEGRVRDAANRLFTTIGEAQRVLADALGRRRHAAELTISHDVGSRSPRFPNFATHSAKAATSSWDFTDHSPWSSYAPAAGRQRWSSTRASQF